MQLDAFMQAVVEDLGVLASQIGATVYSGLDPQHPFVMLAAGQFNGLGLIVGFAGDRTESDDLPHAMSAASVDVYVGQGIDLRADPLAWMYDYAPVETPLLESVDKVRARLLGLTFAGADADDPLYCQYGGIEPVVLPDGTPLRAYRVSAGWPIRIDTPTYRWATDQEV